jgi:hypothetical protein
VRRDYWRVRLLRCAGGSAVYHGAGLPPTGPLHSDRRDSRRPSVSGRCAAAAHREIHALWPRGRTSDPDAVRGPSRCGGRGIERSGMPACDSAGSARTMHNRRVGERPDMKMDGNKRALSCGLAGAVATVCIAWVCAVGTHVRARPPAEFARTRLRLPPGAPPDWHAPELYWWRAGCGLAVAQLNGSIGPTSVPRPIPLGGHPGGNGDPSYTVLVSWAGWPWPALAWWHATEHWPRGTIPSPGRTTATLSEHSAAAWPVKSGPNADLWRGLPLYPVWLGLAGDVAIWTMVIAAGWAMADRVRRRWRRQKSTCPMCRYDLTANTTGLCPECGLLLRHGSKP